MAENTTLLKVGVEIFVRQPDKEGEAPKLEAIIRCSDPEIGAKLYEAIKEDIQELVDALARG